MTARKFFVAGFACAFGMLSMSTPRMPACAPAAPPGQLVVNADQTILIVWNAATKMEHFIRKASFKSDAKDFGFLVPTPTRPDLEESGNGVFPFLQKLTEPEVRRIPRPSGGGCFCASSSGSKSAATGVAGSASVTVLDEKEVAGFKAAVLETESANALLDWLKEHGYAFSPEVKAWVKPYVDAGWKITALKIAKAQEAKDKNEVSAAALRMSFKTDRPIFPYREPDPARAASALNAPQRLLRIYFIGDARYLGEFKDSTWTGKVAWAKPLKPTDRQKVAELLKLRDGSMPSDVWLTEFEHDWPYQVAAADLYFSHDPDQSRVERPPICIYAHSPWPSDITAYAIAVALVLPVVSRRFRRAA